MVSFKKTGGRTVEFNGSQYVTTGEEGRYKVALNPIDPKEKIYTDSSIRQRHSVYPSKFDTRPEDTLATHRGTVWLSDGTEEKTFNVFMRVLTTREETGCPMGYLYKYTPNEDPEASSPYDLEKRPSFALSFTRPPSPSPFDRMLVEKYGVNTYDPSSPSSISSNLPDTGLEPVSPGSLAY